MSDTGHVDWRQYENELKDLCAVKAEEFQMLGYQEVTADEVWQCARQSFRKEAALHELVSAIVGLKVGQFMNYVTMNAYKGVFGSGAV